MATQTQSTDTPSIVFGFGTTCIIVPTVVGTYICTDGKATKTVSSEKKKLYAESGESVPSRGDAEKAVPIGEQLYATIAGNSFWSLPITEFLENEVKILGEVSTPQRCVQKALEVFKDKTYVHRSETQKDVDIQKEPCSMTFTSYNKLGANHETTYVRRNQDCKITWAHVIKKSEEKGHVKSVGEADPLVSFCCHGSGAKYARPILSLSKKLFESSVDMAVHTEEILKAMAWACKNDSHTGGLIQLILLTEEGVEHLYEEQAEDLMKFYEKWLEERDARIARSKSKKEQMKKDEE